MKNKLIVALAGVALLAACGGGSRADQRDYEVVEEGSVQGVTSTIAGPGETVPPITGTNSDTTTAFTLDPNAVPPGMPQPGTIAGTLPPTMTTPVPAAPPPVTHRPPPMTSAAPSPPQRPPDVSAPEPVQPPPTQTDTATAPEEPVEPPPTDTTETQPPPDEKKDEKKGEKKEEPPPPTDTTATTPPPPPPPDQLAVGS